MGNQDIREEIRIQSAKSDSIVTWGNFFLFKQFVSYNSVPFQ